MTRHTPDRPGNSVLAINSGRDPSASRIAVSQFQSIAIDPNTLSRQSDSPGSPPRARPICLADSVVEEEDDYYTAPPGDPSYLEASSSSLASSHPPPFSSLVFGPVSESSHTKVPASQPGPASVSTSTPPPLDEEPLEPDPSLPIVADTKASFTRESKGDSAGKSAEDGEPPPPYTEGSSPIQSFTYVMAAAGGASSLITQVQQVGGPPINTLGGTVLMKLNV